MSRKPNPNEIEFAMNNTTFTRLKKDAPERRAKPVVAVAAGRMKHCDRHDGLAVPEGGVDLGVRWICAKCWLEVQSVRQLRAINQERSKKAA